MSIHMSTHVYTRKHTVEEHCTALVALPLAKTEDVVPVLQSPLSSLTVVTWCIAMCVDMYMDMDMCMDMCMDMYSHII